MGPSCYVFYMLLRILEEVYASLCISSENNADRVNKNFTRWGETEEKIIPLEEGMECVQKGLNKLKKIIEGEPESFTSDEYVMLYTTIYNMCTQNAPHDYSQQLYDKYKEAVEDYILTIVLPSLENKHDEFLLKELEKRWESHNLMVKWLLKFFHYLDKFFINRAQVPALNEVGLCCFRALVYHDVQNRVTDAVIALIDREREGEKIDRALLKNVIDLYNVMGKGRMDYYGQDFEEAMLRDTACYYSRKASTWIVEDSCPEYMLKVEECLKKEKDRASHYLNSKSEEKLLEKVQNQLLIAYTNQLIEKEDSGCRALLRDEKVDDLSRMYSLFHKIPKGIELMAEIFKQYVAAQGMVVVQQSAEAANNKTESSGVSQEQDFVKKSFELHDKYMVFVKGCFVDNSIFHKALKEAFEIFCNKSIEGSSTAETVPMMNEIEYCVAVK